MSQVTKRALEQSLKNLLLKKPLTKITVTDIAEDCGINRMTFYYHFKDIYDLVEWSCLEDARKALEEKKTYDTWQQGFLQIFEKVKENKPFIMNVYRCVHQEQVERYLCRYVHHIDGLPDFSALRFTRYNQYESMILPLVRYLEEHHVTVEYGMDVKNVVMENTNGRRVAKQILYRKDGEEKTINLTEDDLVFITNGCCTDTSCYGDQNHTPDLSQVKNGAGESWDLWKNIAKQAPDGEYGNPDKFCTDFEATNWMSATVATSNEEILQHIIKICKRDPREGKVTTGGIVTVKDSVNNWYLSWTINRQPQFKSQDKGMVLIWLYALNTDKEGNYVKKPMRECTGEEVCREWLYHIGVPVDHINELAAKACNTTTCFMPFINAFFQPRKKEDRPLVVPEGSVNFAFLGQFAETPGDTIFTTEYSMRTGMEAVYTLLNVDRGVPEVWGSKYDVRELLRACYYAIDKKPLAQMDLSFLEREALKVALKKIKGTDVEILLKESGLI